MELQLQHLRPQPFVSRFLGWMMKGVGQSGLRVGEWGLRVGGIGVVVEGFGVE